MQWRLFLPVVLAGCASFPAPPASDPQPVGEVSIRFRWPAGIRAKAVRTIEEEHGARSARFRGKYDLHTDDAPEGLVVSLRGFRWTSATGGFSISDLADGALLTAGPRWVLGPGGSIVRVEGLAGARGVVASELSDVLEASDLSREDLRILHRYTDPKLLGERADAMMFPLGLPWALGTFVPETPRVEERQTRLVGGTIVGRSWTRTLFARVPCTPGGTPRCARVELRSTPRPVDPVADMAVMRLLSRGTVTEVTYKDVWITEAHSLVLDPVTALPYAAVAHEDVRGEARIDGVSERIDRTSTTTDTFTYVDAFH